MPSAPVPTNEAFAQFAVKHLDGGVRAALAYLLAQTDFRFIGIWRFQDGKASAAVHYDRENPAVASADEVPETATYCCYVRENVAPFKTSHAAADARLAAHPAREQVQTYCGVPVVDMAGTLLGTLCCYDLEPRNAEQVNTTLMMMAASYLALGGHVPPYPPARVRALE
ncbi:MAG: GAF domain-containing protein [Pseudomonadota bacterium]